MTTTNYSNLQGIDVPTCSQCFLSAHVKDLDEVLLEVNKKAPQRPIAVVGFSCGSGGKQNEANMFMKMVWFKDGISSRCLREGGLLEKMSPNLSLVLELFISCYNILYTHKHTKMWLKNVKPPVLLSWLFDGMYEVFQRLRWRFCWQIWCLALPPFSMDKWVLYERCGKLDDCRL